MKLQLFSPKDFKPYMEFNPTLGYIQGDGSFEIWLKLKPDRSILANCAKYLVHKPDDEGEPENPHDEYTMLVPIKVTGANQVLPVKFNIRCVFTVNAITFHPQVADFGNLFHRGGTSTVVQMENHSFLPQQYSFVRLPKEVFVITDKGTGTLLPGEKKPIELQYVPTQQACFEEGQIYVRVVTGNICSREIKLPYQANVSKCPLSCDKSRIEYPALPENENFEVVFELSNHSQKNFMIEICPPNPKLSGLMINPLVKTLSSGSSMLISMKYLAAFREFNAQALEALHKLDEKDGQAGEELPKGMVQVRNKRLLAKIEEKKNQEPAKPDPKAKGGAKGGAAKEEKKAPPAKPKKGEVVPDPKEEEERLRKEQEELERQRVAALEANFN